VKRHVVLAILATATPASARPACHGAHSAIESMARLDAHTLRLCWQQPETCFVLDLDAKSPAWTPAAKQRSAPGPSDTIPGVTVGMTVNLCGTDGKDCRDFVVPPRPVTPDAMTYAVANADRSLIAAVSWHTITLFDGKGTRRGAITSWKPEVGIAWSFEHIWFYGDRVFVEMSDGGDADMRVFDTTGTKVVELGDGGGVSRAAPVQLRDGTIALATTYGEKLDVRDRTGKRSKLVEVFGATPSPELSDRAEELALLPDGRVAVARGDGSVALVDVATGTHTVLAAPPECK
jgi:hypothetical protein